MHIVTADAISANGKITNGTNQPSHTWTSTEDWEQFQKLRDSFDLIVMGRNTYEAVRPKPEAARLRVVLTHHLENYQAHSIPGQLEFMNESPEKLIKMFEARGYKRLLLVGGNVNTQFWAAGLVNEVFITIEPRLFGRGQHLAENSDKETILLLQSARQLNERGTMLLHYLVDKTEQRR